MNILASFVHVKEYKSGFIQVLINSEIVDQMWQ